MNKEVKKPPQNIDISRWVWGGLLILFLYGASGFGVFVQKGMLSGMGLGNMNGSYSLDEILSSTVLGVTYFFNKAIGDVDFMALLWEHVDEWLSASGLIIFGAFLVLCKEARFHRRFYFIRLTLYFFRKKIRRVKNKKTSKAWWLLFIASFISFISYPLMLLLTLFFIGVIILCIVFIPSIGFLVGSHQINAAIKKKPCSEFEEIERVSDNSVVKQCGNIVIGDFRVRGSIWLENKEGLFIQTNDAFLYIAKSSNFCVSAKYDTYKNINDRLSESKSNFLNSDIDDKCQAYEKAGIYPS